MPQGFAHIVSFCLQLLVLAVIGCDRGCGAPPCHLGAASCIIPPPHACKIQASAIEERTYILIHRAKHGLSPCLTVKRLFLFRVGA